MITPFPAGGLFNRSTMNAKLEEIGGAITEANWQLIEVLDNTGPMSGTWTAPDFFGDGSAYDLGVYMIGGGGSGEHRTSTAASGGASGYGKNVIIFNVAPNAQYNYVIGAGGVAVSGNANGNAGGTTSFGENEAEGGDGGRKDPGASGGQGADMAQTSTAAIISPRKLYGCCATLSTDGIGGASQSPRDGQNQFDLNMVTLCAGGSAYNQASSSQVIEAMPDGTKGGDGSVTATGNDATGHGNGGGGGHNSSGTATSGSGSDGAIFLYARRPREVTA